LRESLPAKRSFIQEIDALVAKLERGSGPNPRAVTRSSDMPRVVKIGEKPELDSLEIFVSKRL